MALLDFPDFDQLISDIQGCRRCQEMEGCTRVLSWANGPSDSDIMFVGEAPGRLGADRTAIPFHGDKTGDNFEQLLDLAGLSRRDVFVTNAVLCNPRDENGNNAPPSKTALRNCALNLERQISVVQPKLVVTLGAAALEATRIVSPHSLTLADGVRTVQQWFERLLIPLYHPGARAMIHRNFTAQTADYYFVGEAYRRLRRKRRRPGPAPERQQGWTLTSYLLSQLGECSLFRLHKAIYLIELESLKAGESRATDFIFIRQKDGPYCVELGSRWFGRFGDALVVKKVAGAVQLRWKEPPLFTAHHALDSEVARIANKILAEIAPLTDGQLKTRAYLTRPMRAALKAEREGSSALNRPLL